MEVTDAAWRAVLASIDRYATGEELLEALLSDKQTASDPLDDSGRCALGRKGPLSLPPSPSTSSSTEGADPFDTTTQQQEQHQSSHPPKKRRRVPQTRPKEEIDRLRDSYAELTALLKLLEQRQVKRTCGTGHARLESAADARVTARVWKSVAGRQYQYLRDSQTINQKLRMQLRVQMNVIQSFVRLIKRAQAGLPTLLLPQSIRESATELYEIRRARLRTAIDTMASGLTETMADDPFTRSFDDDFREVWLPPDGTNLPASALLATSSAGYLAPRSQQVISERWWERIRKRTSRIQDLRFKHVDRSDNSETVSYSVGFSTAIGSATYSGLAMSRRIECSDGSIVFVGVHELSPTEDTSAPMTAVEYHMETVSRILPFQCSESFSQVVVKTTATRLERPLVPTLTEGQSSILRRYVSDTLDFLHVQLQQQLDVDLHEIMT